MIAYLYDDSLRRKLNARKQNYWDVYHQEICNQLGVTAAKRSLAQLENAASLEGLRTLILGCQSSEKLTDKARENIGTWVEKGGLLIGFAVSGLDAVFGVETKSTLAQPIDDYTIAAYFQFWPHTLTREIHPFMHIEQKLFALSDVRLVTRKDCAELAHLYDTNGNDIGQPAITFRAYGKGHAAFFAFDVAKTIWLLHQGKLLPEVPEGQFALRTPLLQVIRNNCHKIAYADEMVHLLQNIIATTGQPFVYPIPPDDGQIPDALFYYSGDEYTGPVELSLQASDYMASQGLPYHINIAAHLHPMTKAEFDHIRRNGHEVSAYMWLWTEDKKGSILSAAHFKMQCEALKQRFGVNAGSVLVGSCQWCGWAETARWLAQAGATADNTFFPGKASEATPGSQFGKRFANPWYNGPAFGFGFGTTYPFFFYESHDHGNERIALQEQPIVCFELGHRASNAVSENPHVPESETFSPDDFHEPIDRAVRYHWVMNVFYHPYYIARYPHCREAIAEIKRYIAYKSARVLHMANNAVADWWNARARARVGDIEFDGDSLRFTASCDWRDGMIIRMRWNGRGDCRAYLDDTPLTHTIKHEFGEDWLYLVLHRGDHRVRIRAGESA